MKLLLGADASMAPEAERERLRSALLLELNAKFDE